MEIVDVSKPGAFSHYPADYAESFDTMYPNSF